MRRFVLRGRLSVAAIVSKIQYQVAAAAPHQRSNGEYIANAVTTNKIPTAAHNKAMPM